MKIACMTFNPIQENTYLVWDATREAIIVDAGNFSRHENESLATCIAENKLKIVAAINTHGHFDHTLGVQFVKTRYGVPFALSKADEFLLDTSKINSSLYGLDVGEAPSIDIDLAAEKEIRFGESVLQVIPTPGHTPGHVAFYSPTDKVVFTGDTLFCESIGRTDLPGGDYSWIMRSILDNLLPLGDETTIYPGHGGKSTIGHETLYNPFIVEVLNNEVNYKG